MKPIEKPLPSAKEQRPKESNSFFSITNISGSQAIDWPDIIPLIQYKAQDDFPINATPETFKHAVEEFKDYVQAPVSLIASSALGALSASAQGHIDIQRDQELRSPTGLYLLTIADSGERKSTCDSTFTSEIRKFQADERERLKPELNKRRAEITAWEAEYKGITGKIEKSSDNHDALIELKEKLEALECSRPGNIYIPTILRMDETPESLPYSLVHHWPSGAIISGEAGIIFGSYSMNKENIVRNISQLNILWDGGEIPINRKGSPQFTVKDVRLTVALQSQRATLMDFFKKSGDIVRGSGFLARFLVNFPASTQGYRKYTEPKCNNPEITRFNKRIRQILEKPLNIDSEGIKPQTMQLLAPAKKIWVEFYNETESKLKHGGEYADIRDIVSKIADNTCRIAALLHFFEHDDYAVSLTSMEASIKISQWYLNEAERFYTHTRYDEFQLQLEKLTEWMLKDATESNNLRIKKRRLLQYGPLPLRNSSKLDKALRSLEANNYVRTDSKGNININPHLFENL